MADRLDIVIFGATGFTGKHAVEAVHNLTNVGERKLSWGIAGRSEKKLQDVLIEVSTKIDKELKNIPLIIADIKDEESLKKMTAQARIIINTCGPYRFFGEPVIKACLETKTHHVDVSGEPQYIESMQLKYHQEALEKEIYFVSACGFDSIPADLGLVALQQKYFDGTLNSAETYLSTKPKTEGSKSGSVLNFGTWESAVYGLAHYDELRTIRSQLYPNRLPQFKPKLAIRGKIHKSDVTGLWTVPFLGSDRSVILRSQRHFYEAEKKRPVQVQTYLSVPSLIALIFMAIFGAIFSVLVKFEFGRKLLLQYPGFFSAGLVTKDNPSEEVTKNTYFECTIVGNGWSKDVVDTDGNFDVPPNKTVAIKVSGVDPGYTFTATTLTLAALKILEEKSKMPNKGGVYSPGAAFANTSLFEELTKNGLNVELLSKI